MALATRLPGSSSSFGDAARPVSPIRASSMSATAAAAAATAAGSSDGGNVGTAADRFRHATVPRGFQFLWEYDGHLKDIKCCIHNPQNRNFASLDERSMRLWTPAQDHMRVTFPPAQASFITDIIFVPKRKLYFAAALDMAIKVYDANLNLKASVKLGQRAVLTLAFNERTDELISGGADGVCVWRLTQGKIRKWVKRWEDVDDFKLTLRCKLPSCDSWISKVEENAQWKMTAVCVCVCVCVCV